MGKNDDKTWEQADNKSLNNIEYIMSGRIFKFEELSSERRFTFILSIFYHIN